MQPLRPTSLNPVCITEICILNRILPALASHLLAFERALPHHEWASASGFEDGIRIG